MVNRIVGKQAPHFCIKAVSGDDEYFLRLSLDTYKGRWLVLFFYPMDFTFICPTEITSFSRDFARFKEAGADLLAVSTDSEYCHQAWIRNGLGKISYPLGSDKTMSMAADYGVLSEDEGIALRGLFIIDPDQTIRYSVVHDNNVGRSTKETLRVLKALQTGSLCGADWSINSPVLKPAASEHISVSPVPSYHGTIRIYTQPNCSYCSQIKQFLSDHQLAYEEIDLSSDQEGQRFMEKRGYSALPVTVIGNQEISGFRLDKIKEILHID